MPQHKPKRTRRPAAILLIMVMLAALAALTAGFLLVVKPMLIQANVGPPEIEQDVPEPLRTSTTTPTTTTTTTQTKPTIPPLTAVPVILQLPELPTGCESTAAAMLLQAYGYSYTKEEVADALPKQNLETVDGQLYGPDPHEVFIGNPYSSSGFGVYSEPLADTMQMLIDEAGGGATVRLLTGGTEQDILDAVDAGQPVCIWATMYMEPSLVGNSSWYLIRDGVYTDEVYEWLGNEHCLVLVDYDDTTVTVHDPLSEQAVPQTYSRSLFFTRWEEQGRQALVLDPE